MITSKVLLVADRAIRDNETGNLSIINIIEDITAESFPILIPRLTIVAFIHKEQDDNSKPNLRFKLLNNETSIGDHSIKVDFREKNRTKAIIQLGTVPIREPGIAHFILTDAEGNEIDKYSINLNLREEIKVTTE